jgi:hypothetical protein
MKKLSKHEVEAKDDLVSDFQKKSAEVERLWSEYEDAVNALNEAISDLNSTVDDMNSFVQEVATQMEDFYDEKSEKWQQSDTGSAYSDWKSEWEQIEVSMMDEIAVDAIDLPDIEEFEQVATEFHE